MNQSFQSSRASRSPRSGEAGAWSVARVIGERVDGLCMVTGMTPLDARVMSVLDMAVGDAVTLDLGGDIRLAAHVRWVEGAVAGIGFDAAVHADDAEDSTSVIERQVPRFRRCVPVRLERHGREQPGELVDISQHGACIVAPAQPWLRLGTGVVLEIDGCDPIDAEIRWQQGERIGLVFHSHVQLWKLDKRLQEWGRICESCTRGDCADQAQRSRVNPRHAG